MVDRNSSIPMYAQLGSILENAIKDGEYKEGDKLPSESRLCKKYSVSRVTVRQAFNLLEQKGLVYTAQGKGTFVKEIIINQELLKVINFGKILLEKGLAGHTRIKSFKLNSDDARAKEMFDSDDTDGICNLNLVGYSRKTPIVYYQSYFYEKTGILMHECAKELEKESAAFSSYDLYSRIGIDIEKIYQKIMAVNANKEISKVLNIPSGQALLLLESKLYGSENTPLEYKLGYYRSDKFAFSVKREII